MKVESLKLKLKNIFKNIFLVLFCLLIMISAFVFLFTYAPVPDNYCLGGMNYAKCQMQKTESTEQK